MPGKIHHARWLTLASRILRFYVAEEYLSQDLVQIVQYVVRVYVPVLF